jgi:hypothetical protein
MANQWETKASISRAARQGVGGVRLFIVSSGILLFVTGAAKLISALGNSAVLAKPDPLFGIHFNYLLLSVGLVELVIAVFCFTSANRNLVLGLVALLSINFLGYRIGLWLGDWPGYCPCLGSLTEAIHLSRRHANLLTLIILIYLLAGSSSLLARSWWATHKGRRQPVPNAETPAVISGYFSHRSQEKLQE